MGTIRKSDYFIHKNFDVSSLSKSNLTRGPAYSYIRVDFFHYYLQTLSNTSY